MRRGPAIADRQRSFAWTTLAASHARTRAAGAASGRNGLEAESGALRHDGHTLRRGHRHHRLIRRIALFYDSQVIVANTIALAALVQTLLIGKEAAGSGLQNDAHSI